MWPVVCLVAAGFGVFLVVGGAAGWFTTPERAARRPVAWRDLGQRFGLLAAAGVVAWLVTGWVAAGVLAAAAAWWLPAVLGAQAERGRRIERTEAVATWSEQLRDVVAASGGIGEAMASTAAVAPSAIRTETTEFARRMRRESPDAALAWLGTALDDPTADRVVVALRMAVSERVLHHP